MGVSHRTPPRRTTAGPLAPAYGFEMAKDKIDKDKSTSTTVVPTVRPDDPPPSAASPGPKDRSSSSVGRAPAPSTTSVAGNVVAQAGEVAATSVRVTKRLLPGRVPAYLGAGALLVAGIVDLPALVAGGLAYEALRRWNPPSS